MHPGPHPGSGLPGGFLSPAESSLTSHFPFEQYSEGQGGGPPMLPCSPCVESWGHLIYVYTSFPPSVPPSPSFSSPSPLF